MAAVRLHQQQGTETTIKRTRFNACCIVASYRFGFRSRFLPQGRARGILFPIIRGSGNRAAAPGAKMFVRHQPATALATKARFGRAPLGSIKGIERGWWGIHPMRGAWIRRRSWRPLPSHQEHGDQHSQQEDPHPQDHDPPKLKAGRWWRSGGSGGGHGNRPAAGHRCALDGQCLGVRQRFRQGSALGYGALARRRVVLFGGEALRFRWECRIRMSCRRVKLVADAGLRTGERYPVSVGRIPGR